MPDRGDTPATPDACPACGTALAGRFCHGCGQDAEARPRPLRDMVEEALSETTLIDSRLARTVVALSVAPARLLVGYQRGAGSLHVSPVKIFVVMTALFLAVLNFSDVVIYQFTRQVIPGQPVTASADPDGYTVHFTGVVEQERWMQRRIEPPIDPRVTAAIQHAADRATNETDRASLAYEIEDDRTLGIVTERLAAWLPNALWLLMPVHALLLAPLFGRRRLFMEHLVFAMWAHATAFILLILLALANRFGTNLPAWPMLGPYLLYFTLAARRYYAVSMASAAWRSVAHTALYTLLVLLPAALVVMASATDWGAFMAYLRA